MSKLISVKISNELFEDIERMIRKSKTTRNAYVNQALKLMNRFQNRKRLRKILQIESQKVRTESKKILQEFESIQDEGMK